MRLLPLLILVTAASVSGCGAKACSRHGADCAACRISTDRCTDKDTTEPGTNQPPPVSAREPFPFFEGS